MRQINIMLAVLILLVAAPYYWLLLDTTSVGTKAKPLTIEQLRDLAASKRGKLPSEVRYELIGSRDISGNLIAAGTGLKEIPVELLAFQILTPGKPAITIDSGLAPDLVPQFHVERYSPEAQARTTRAVAQAGLVLNLGPGPTHMGGADAKAWFRRDTTGLPTRPAEREDAPYAVAPGVVAIPVSGLVEGTTIFFVRTADGSEYLFAGDVAPVTDSWRFISLPARWATSRNPHLDRDELASWLKTVRALKRQSRSLQIVEGNNRALPTTMIQGFDLKLDKMSHSSGR